MLLLLLFCIIQESPNVLVVPNALEDIRFKDNCFVTPPSTSSGNTNTGSGVVFYAGSAIIVKGQKLGKKSSNWCLYSE